MRSSIASRRLDTPVSAAAADLKSASSLAFSAIHPFRIFSLTVVTLIETASAKLVKAAFRVEDPSAKFCLELCGAAMNLWDHWICGTLIECKAVGNVPCAVCWRSFAKCVATAPSLRTLVWYFLTKSTMAPLKSAGICKQIEETELHAATLSISTRTATSVGAGLRLCCRASPRRAAASAALIEGGALVPDPSPAASTPSITSSCSGTKDKDGPTTRSAKAPRVRKRRGP